MADRPTFQDAIQRVRQGSEEALIELINRFGAYINAVIRRRLDQRLRSKYETVDFSQEVWLALWQHPSRAVGCQQSNDLRSYLAQIARNKVCDAVRKRLSDTYDVRMETELDEFRPEMGQGATGSQRFSAHETWDRIQMDLNDLEQEVLKLRLMGESFAEIGNRLNIGERRARRIVDRIRNMPNEEDDDRGDDLDDPNGSPDES